MTQHNDTQQYDTQHYDTQHYDTQHYDTQHNDIQQKDIQFEGLFVALSINDAQHSTTVPSGIILSVAFY